MPLLINWFRENRRTLPWREESTPYRVWISEIMLQQTRIEAVVPYYRRFLKELPTVEALAACEDEKLMKLWEGLGYYSRARNLKQAALRIVGEYGGELPERPEELKKLPGIGDYTAGAIASIAFGRAAPAVDGNVLRVMARLLAFEDDVLKPGTRKGVSELLKESYPTGEEAALFTQGLMELGETVCIPNTAPYCGVCPWKGLCLAHREGREQLYPVRSPKKSRRIEKRLVIIAEDNGRFALRKRPESGLLAGLWEFPNLIPEEGVPSEEAVKKMGFMYKGITPCGETTHLFTHVEWRMQGVRLEDAKASRDYRWCAPREILDEYAIPSAFRPFLKLIAKEKES